MGHGRIARLSDDNEITRLCLEERPVNELVRDLYLRVFSRPPLSEESELFVSWLAPHCALGINPGKSLRDDNDRPVPITDRGVSIAKIFG